VVQADNRNGLVPERLGSGDPTMPGDNDAVLVDQDRVVEAERSDAGCNLSDLLGTVRPGVSAVRPKARQGVQ
jgi:hypothetical protein